MALNWEITGNNSKLMRALKESQQAVQNTANTFEKAGKNIDGVFVEIEQGAQGASNGIKDMIKQMAAMGGITLSLAGLQQFIAEVVNVRKEMQSLHTSFSVLLGDQAKADKMFGELKEFASTTPYMLNTLASGAQMMLGFGVASEKVVPILKQIGDIAMGDGQKMQSLTLAFSQMSATGKLMGQDLLQMINAGFNPLMEMSRKTGKSIADLKDEMSKGAISAEMVADAFRSATEEGGQFYGMTAAMGDTLAGKMNTLSGAINDMMNSIGESTDGIINSSVEGLTIIVQNYEKVGKALATIIASYGTYKAAVMLNYAIELKNAMGAEAAAVAIWHKITATKAATVAQTAFNAVAKLNPYVIIATAAVAAAGAIWTFARKTDEATKAQERMNESLADVEAAYEKEESKVRMLEAAVNDNNRSIAARKKAIKDLEEIVPGYHASLSKEGELYGNNKKAIDDYLKSKKLEMKMNAVSDLAQEQMKKKAEAEAKIQQKKAELAAEVEQATTGGITSIFSNIYHGNKAESVRAEIREAEKEVKEAEAALEPYQKMLEDTNKELLDLKGGQEEVKTQSHDYEYWKNMKEDAEKRLKALTDIKGDEKEVLALKKEIADYDKKMKAYDVSSSKPSSDTVMNNSIKMMNLMTKQSHDEQRRRIELMRETEQAVIDQQEEGARKRRMQIDLDFEMEKDAIEAWYEDIKQTRIEEAKKIWETDKANKGKVFDQSSADVEYTEEEKKAYQEKMNAAIMYHQRAIAEELDIDESYRIEYIKSFGTLEQQKLAIVKEYEKKIAKAETESQKKLLQAERDEVLNEINVDIIANGIDWGGIVQGLGGAIRDVAEKTLEEVEAYIKSADFGNLNQAQQERIYALRSKLAESTGDNTGSPFDMSMWTDLADKMEIYKRSVKDTYEANKRHQEASNKLKEAQEALTKATTQEQAAVASAAVAMAEMEVAATGKDLEDKQKKQSGAKADVEDAETRTENSLNNFAGALNEITDGSLFGFANGLVKLIQAIGGNNTSGLSGLGKAGGIIGAILQIIDMIGEDFSGFFDDLFVKITAAVDSILEQSGSGKIVESIGKNIGNLVTHIIKDLGNTIAKLTADFFSFDPERMFANVPFIGDAYAETEADYQEKIQRKIDIANERLYRIHQDMVESNSGNAQQNLIDLEKLYYERERLLREQMYSALNDNYGGGHSDKYHWNKNTKQTAQRILNEYGLSGDRWEDVIKQLTPDIADDIRKNHPEWYTLMMTQGYNDGKFKEFYDQLADMAGELDQNLLDFAEALTGVSFDSLRDGFASTLSDMESDATSFLEDIRKKFLDAQINDWMDTAADENGDTFNDRLKKWQQKWAAFITSEGELSEYEKEQLLKEYNDLVNEALDARNKMADALDVPIYVESFSSVKDKFKALMTDMTATAEDFANNFSQLLYDAMINERMQNVYNAQIQSWYDKYAKAMSDGNVTSEEMEALRQEYLNLIDTMRSDEEIISEVTGYGKQKLMEKVTGTTVDALKSDFDNLVMSFDATAQDFADNFAKYMQDALKKARLDPMLESGLNEWYEQFYQFLESNGELTEAEIETLREKYMSLAQDAQQQAEEIARITGTWEAQMREKAMGMSLDSFKSNFVGMLSSLDGSAEDFADNFSKMMYDALINSQIEAAFGTKMKGLYEKMADFLINGGDVASEEYQTLLDEYIALGNEASNMAEDLANKLGVGLDTLREKFTQTSYSSVRSEFESLLMDMDSNASDFAENFTEYLQKAIINAQMSELLDDNLKKWYKNFATAMEDGNLTDEELNDLRTEYDAIVEDALKQREALANITGYGKGPYSQSGTSAFQGMSQDTGDELNGRFTALQIAGESIEGNTSMIAAQMSEIGMQMQAFITASQILQQTVGEITTMLVYMKSNQDEMVSGSMSGNAMMSRKLDAIANKLSRL